jgi:hypothetical protein
MMTDTIIANMPPEGLRSIMRGLLGVDPNITQNLNELASKYLAESRPPATPNLFIGSTPTSAFYETQGRYRCLMGCGYGFESVKTITDVIRQAGALEWDGTLKRGNDLLDVLASVDGDVIQAVTAIQKELLTVSGVRVMNVTESKLVNELRDALQACQIESRAKKQEFAFERGLSILERFGGSSSLSVASPALRGGSFESGNSTLETVKLGSATVPRMFMGLWQFSSPSWGSASRSKINADFRKHVDAGFTAYGMRIIQFKKMPSSS